MPMPSGSRPPRLTEIAHREIAAGLSGGGIAIDATAGNGHDTLYLAERVGPEGQVFALDVQESALEATRARLEQAGIEQRVILMQSCHSQLESVLNAGGVRAVNAIMFNLGYLPGGDKSLTTQPGTSVAALRGAVSLLAAGGVITIVAYSGHPGGRLEADAIELAAANLEGDTFQVSRHSLPDQSSAPELTVIRRLSLS